MSAWRPTTYFPDLAELLEDTATFSHNNGGAFFSVTIPRKDWEAMGRPGRISFEPFPVIPSDLRDATGGNR